MIQQQNCFQVLYLVKFPPVTHLTVLPITHLVLGVDEDICTAWTKIYPSAEMYLSSAIL